VDLADLPRTASIGDLACLGLLPHNDSLGNLAEAASVFASEVGRTTSNSHDWHSSGESFHDHYCCPYYLDLPYLIVAWSDEYCCYYYCHRLAFREYCTDRLILPRSLLLKYLLQLLIHTMTTIKTVRILTISVERW